MKILFWDIDGTLLRTDKAGLYAFQQAIEEIWHAQVDFRTIKTSGMTDGYIASQVIRMASGREATAKEISALVERYEQLLPVHLAKREGHLTPSVQEILMYFHNKPDYLSLLLTGNTITGAQAKLSYYGLIDYFDFTASAFSQNYFDRSQIAAQALSTVQCRYPDVPSHNLFVIGDTPHDISCGKAIGANTIAVATGTYSLPELAVHDPWWAVETLPCPQDLEKKLATTD